MSKSSLKKEISSFTNEQLVELILNVYGASKEAKTYFEFFLNPDGEALLQKKVDAIDKELRRSKWGYSKGRISVIRKEIKEFEAYGVGVEYTARLYWLTAQLLMMHYRFINYPEALLKGTFSILSEYIVYCNKNDMLTQAVQNVRQFANRAEVSTDGMRNRALQVMENTLKDLR